MQTGVLYIVATPIGNLEDISLRAMRILKEADLVAAEDTRRTALLLASFGIKKPLLSFYSANAKKRMRTVVDCLKEGRSVALVSDSGTPGISDPGSALVRECVREDIAVTAIPGPSAFVTALVLSGLDTHKFVFEGFLSNKSARRRKRLEELLRETRTVVLYESPHRIEKFLADFRDLAGERTIVLARELTKKFEEVKRGTAAQHLERFRNMKPRGEFVVVF